MLRVFQIPREPDDSAVRRDFSRLLKRKGGRGEFGYVLRDVPAPGASLAFDRHDPEVAVRRAELSVLGAAVTLDEVFTLIGAGIHLVDARDLPQDEVGPECGPGRQGERPEA